MKQINVVLDVGWDGTFEDLMKKSQSLGIDSLDDLEQQLPGWKRSISEEEYSELYTLFNSDTLP